MENRGVVKKFLHVCLKGLSLVSLGLFSQSPGLLTVGFTEHEAVLRGSGGMAGVYGLFEVVLDRHQRRLSIEKVEYLSRTYKAFVQKLIDRNHRSLFYIYLWTFGAVFGLSIFAHCFRRSRASWRRVLQKYFGKKKKPVQKVFVQKKIFCEVCGIIPANVMFAACGHLVYCWDCFRGLEGLGLDAERRTCSRLECSDCGAPNEEFKRIVYS